MTASKRYRDKWKLLKENNDLAAIAAEIKAATGRAISTATISRAINGKPCKENTFIAVRDFYAKREGLLKEA